MLSGDGRYGYGWNRREREKKQVNASSATQDTELAFDSVDNG